MVVPTRDRVGSLRECLRALEGQTLHDHEVVVVDDGSVDDAAVAGVVAGFDRARLVRARGDGPARARNLGVAAARAPVIAFTDDDCRPEATWLATLTRRIEAGETAVAGIMVNADPTNAAAAAAQTITNHLVEASFDQAMGTVRFAPTSNLAVSTAVATDLPFDDTYPLAAGEDRAWCDALAARGLGLAFEPDAVVWHHQDLDWRRFWHQQVRYGRGGHRFHRQSSHRGTGQPPRFYLDLVRKGFRHGPGTGAMVVLAQVAAASGSAREAWTARRG